jgi:hypothetical protein
MSPNLPSVNDTYFQHKVLTRVHGQPNYETLQTLTTEIKANASSVPSTLGGGQYGHLGLILSADRYATLANTVPWVSPPNPGPFAPPAGGTGPQIEAAKDVWRELKLSFELCQATEKALVAQIVESIDQIYLRALLNRTSYWPILLQYSRGSTASFCHSWENYASTSQSKGDVHLQHALRHLSPC